MPYKEKVSSLPTDQELVAFNEDRALEAEIAIREQSTDLAPLAESPALNRLLLRNARKSLNEIGQITGIPVNEVAERMTVLLDERSWRDDLQEEKLLIIEISMLVDDIRERMARFNVEDEGWASMARVQLTAIKTILEQIEKRRKSVDGQLKLVTQQMVEAFGEVIKFNNDLTAKTLAEKFGIEEEVVYAEWEENYPKAIAILQARAKND